jgi:hypothetical protein
VVLAAVIFASCEYDTWRWRGSCGKVFHSRHLAFDFSGIERGLTRMKCDEI